MGYSPWALKESDMTECLHKPREVKAHVRACILNYFCSVRLCVTLQTLACQAPLSMGFSRQEYWSELPCPPLRDFPDSGTEPVSLTSPVLAGGFFTTGATWEATKHLTVNYSAANKDVNNQKY